MNQPALLESPVSKKRDDQAVKIERQLASMLRVIAEAENISRPRAQQTSAAEILSNLVREEVEDLYEKALKILARKPKQPK